MHHGLKEKAFRERRLAKACEYVTDLWLPVNPSHLEKIRRGLDTDGYRGELSLLMDDLKQDPALFLFCLRELFKLLREHGDLSSKKSPLEIFEDAGLATLKEILSVEAHGISKHTVSSFTEPQVGRIQEMLTSAAATEVLCEAASIDPDLGFTVAIFRQLGFALVAWNYPSVYQLALSEVSAKENFEAVLARHLGFSPALLAIRLARAWGAPAQVVASFEVIEDGESTDLAMDEHQISDAISSALASLCRIGESLARANQPERYPQARADWNEARNAIEQRLGTDGLAVIKRRFQEYSTAYIDLAPGIFKAGLVLDPEVRISSMERVAGISENIPRCYRQCDLPMQESLRELYQSLEASKDIQAALEFWKSRLVLTSGFTGGHVFSVEPALQELIAHLSFGGETAHSGGNIPLNHGSELVSLAFRNGTPIVREYMTPEGGTYSAIAGSFGFSQRVGVLYVEIPRVIYTLNPDQFMIHFRSLAQSLNDCLRLT